MDHKETEPGVKISKEQTERLQAMFASAFTHFKKIATAEAGHAILPPTPEESRNEYLNDPMVNRCVDVCLSATLSILSDKPSNGETHV